MIKYRKDNALGIRKYAIAGLSLLAALTAFRCACSPREESAGEKVRIALEELNGSPELLRKNYGIIANLAEQGMDGDYANQFVRKGIEVIEKGNHSVDKSVYLAMFDMIRQKAEERPELMDHFGIRARSYSERKVIEKYLSLLRKGGNPLDAFDRKAPGIEEIIELGRQYLIGGK